MSRTQEILLSSKNRELLLTSVYSMMGYEISEEEKERQRYKDVVLDLNDILHDVNTDFIRVLQLIQSRSEDLRTVNRQIALKVFERWEHRNESFFLHERRLEEREQLKRESIVSDPDTAESQQTTRIKRSEVILFQNSKRDEQGSVLDSFHFTAQEKENEKEKEKEKEKENDDKEEDDFFGNSKMNPRAYFTSLSLNPKQ